MEQLELFDFTATGLAAGVDEAGRGPLAGPVCAAAVILGEDFDVSILDDSKKLSGESRERIAPIIKEKAIDYAVVFRDVDEIGRLNILGATLDAMRECIETLAGRNDLCLVQVDGNRRPPTPSLPDLSVQTIVKGDAKIPAIMAASILAKTERDRLMVEYDRLYPQYGFAVNKGYGTAAHREAILRFGPCPIHRPLFLRKILRSGQE